MGMKRLRRKLDKLQAVHDHGRDMTALPPDAGPKSDRGAACPRELRGDGPAASAPDARLNGAL